MCVVELGGKVGFLLIHLLLSLSLFISIPQIITMSRTAQNSRSQTRPNQFVCNKKEEEHAHSFGSVGYILRRPAKRQCLCEEGTVLRTLTDISSLNFEKKRCRNYRNSNEKGCNFFKWFDDDIVDERDLKIERQKKKSYV
jgi:hypothetical protein